MCIKLSIISAGALPIPATKGGGVETLIQYFIDENEQKREFEIVLYTISGAEHLQARYQNTKFINLVRKSKVDQLVQHANSILYGLNRRTVKIPSMKILNSYEKQVIRCLKRDSSDVVLFENNLTLLLRKNSINSKIAFHAHYDDVRRDVSEFDKKRYRYCYNKIDANISVSSFVSRRICDVIGTGIRYFTVQNCIDTERFDNPSCEMSINVKRKYSIPEGMTIVMYSGRITEEKGVQQLISAFRGVKTEACLVIVGGIFYSDNSENAYLLQLKELAKSCTNPVVFTGYVDYSDMHVLWSIADIAVVPTYGVEEAAGLVAIEAMAAGKPVIISDSGALREYTTEKCAIVVERGELFIEKMTESIEYLCQNVCICEEMGLNAKAHSASMTKGRYYREMSNTLRQICEKGDIHGEITKHDSK